MVECWVVGTIPARRAPAIRVHCLSSLTVPPSSALSHRSLCEWRTRYGTLTSLSVLAVNVVQEALVLGLAMDPTRRRTPNDRPRVRGVLPRDI